LLVKDFQHIINNAHFSVSQPMKVLKTSANITPLNTHGEFQDGLKLEGE